VLVGLLGLLGLLAPPLGRVVGTAIGRHLVRDDHPTHADAIVVLGGDVHKRAPHAVRLYQQGVAPVVLAVGGTADQGSLAEARKTARVLHAGGVPDQAVIIVGRDEPNTVAEAAAVARVATEHGWDTLVVVTSPYHTWRAGQIVEAAVPGDIRVLLSPSPEDPFDPSGWWRDQRQRRLVRNEYGKFLLWKLGL